MNEIPFIAPLAVLTILVIVVSLFILFGKTTYLINEKHIFSFRNHFPHEIYYQSNKSIVTYFRIMIIALFAISLTSNILFVTSFRNEYSIFAFVIVIGLMFILSSLTSLILFMLKPNFLKQFKIYSTLVFVFNIMSNGMLGILLLNSKIYSSVVYKVLASFAFILLAVNFLLAINPKLKDWDKLEEVKNSDGTLSYIRPKISWLAYSLWISFSTLILGEIIMLISMILSSLKI